MSRIRDSSLIARSCSPASTPPHSLRRAGAGSADAGRCDRSRASKQPSPRRGPGARRGRAGGGQQRAELASKPIVERQRAATRAPITSTSFRFRSPTARVVVVYPDIPDNFVIARRRFSGRSTRRAAPTRSSARRSPKPRRSAPISTAARADLRLEIVRAYWAAVTAREAVRVLEESAARAEAQVRDARQRFDVGLIPPNEVSSLEAQRSRERAQLIEARNLREAALIELRRLIGVPPRHGDRARGPARSGAQGCAGCRQVRGGGARISSSRRSRRGRSGRRSSLRLGGAEARQAGGADGQQADHRLRGRRRLRQPEPAHFPAQGRVAGVVGRRRQRQLELLRLRPHEGAGGRSGGGRARRRASGSPSSMRSSSADVRQRLLDLDSSQAMVRAAARRGAERRRSPPRGGRSFRRRRRHQHRRARRAGGAARSRAGADARAGRASGSPKRGSNARWDDSHDRTSAPCRRLPRRSTSAGLTRRFGTFVAVDDLSFSVKQGEIFGFLGANGAGKSTTIRMLCGLLRRPSGTALVGGVDVSRDPEGVKRRIGYMSQKFSLYEALTVDQNIRFFGGIYGLSRRALRGAARVRARDGRARRPRRHADARSARRLAPAPRARLRHPARAVDRVSRRADRRRRSAVAPPVLGSDRRPVAPGRDRAGHDALPGRSGALPSHRDHPGRQARGARHRHRAEAGVRGAADRRDPRVASRSTAMDALDAHDGGREDQPVRHRGARRAAIGRRDPTALAARAAAPRASRSTSIGAGRRRRSKTCSSTSSSGSGAA